MTHVYHQYTERMSVHHARTAAPTSRRTGALCPCIDPGPSSLTVDLFYCIAHPLAQVAMFRNVALMHMFHSLPGRACIQVFKSRMIYNARIRLICISLSCTRMREPASQLDMRAGRHVNDPLLNLY